MPYETRTMKILVGPGDDLPHSAMTAGVADKCTDYLDDDSPDPSERGCTYCSGTGGDPWNDYIVIAWALASLESRAGIAPRGTTNCPGRQSPSASPRWSAR